MKNMKTRGITVLFLSLAVSLLGMPPLPRPLEAGSTAAAAVGNLTELVPAAGIIPGLPGQDTGSNNGPPGIPSAGDAPPAATVSSLAAANTASPAASNSSGRSYTYQGNTDAPSSQSQAAAPASADTAAPRIYNARPPDGSFTGPSTILSAEYSDPEPSSGIDTETAMIHLDGKHQYGCTVTESSITCQKSGLNDGTHKLEAFVCDNAQNCSHTAWSFTADAIAPNIKDTQPTGSINSSSATIEAAFDDGAGAGVNSASTSVMLDGKKITSSCAANADGVSCNVSGLAEGGHDVAIEVADNVGNRASKNWSFKVDFSAIGVTGQTPAAGSWQRSATPLIRASFQKTSQGAIDPDSISMYVDNDDVTPQTERDESSASYSPKEALAEGLHQVRVTVSDDAGHSGDSEWSFSIDTLPPEISGESPTGSAAAIPEIKVGYSDKGSGIDTSSANLVLDGQDKTSAAEADEHGVRYTPDVRLSPGTHTAQISVGDYAGNLQALTWEFSVAAPPDTPVLPPPAGTPGEIIRIASGYWYYMTLPNISLPGSWAIAGFPVWPNTYYLPWYDPKPSPESQKSELAIVNQGAGEAIVSVFVAGESRWQGTVPEGGQEIRELPGAAGGPVKVICPTGQSLAVSHRVSGPGFISENAAVPVEQLEAESVLPWYEPHPVNGAGSSLVIANAGETEAAVEIHIGDPEGPDSLKGHYAIKPGTAATAELPDAGGPVKITSTTGQPLIVSQQVRFKGSFMEVLATGLNHLAQNYVFKEEAAPQDQILASRILIGNPGTGGVRVEIRTGGRLLSDPDNPGNDYLLIAGGESRSLPLAETEEPVEVSCLSCSFAEGLAVSRENVRNNSLDYLMGIPRPPAEPGAGPGG